MIDTSSKSATINPITTGMDAMEIRYLTIS